MGMFTPNKRRKVPGINTSSLPDLIFTILFFFMIVANIRKSEPHIALSYPEGSTLEKNMSSQFSHYIYIGMKDGHEYVQLDDEDISLDKLEKQLLELVKHADENSREQFTVSLGIDKYVKMNVVEKVRQAVKKSGILHVNYIGRDLKGVDKK